MAGRPEHRGWLTGIATTLREPVTSVARPREVGALQARQTLNPLHREPVMLITLIRREAPVRHNSAGVSLGDDGLGLCAHKQVSAMRLDACGHVPPPRPGEGHNRPATVEQDVRRASSASTRRQSLRPLNYVP